MTLFTNSLFKNWLFTCLLTLSATAYSFDIADIETAFARNDITALQQLHRSFGKQTNSYNSLLLSYRLAAAYIQNGNKKAARLILSDAIRWAKGIKDDAEIQVLLAACYGLKIITRPLSALSLNGKTQKALRRAQALDPDNPRALLMLGVAKFQTPGLFGGSNKKALALLQQGLKGLKNDSSQTWGAIDLHLWLGRVSAELDNKELARQHYRQALKLSPENHWVLQAMEGNGFAIKKT